jgi:hypothetical protein
MRARRAGAALLVLLVLLLPGCAPVIDDKVTIDLDTRDPTLVRVAVITSIDNSQPRNAAVEARVRLVRDLLIAGHDEWSERFARAMPDNERVAWDKQRGTVVRGEHSGTLAAEALQRFFSDLPMTIQLTRADGLGELTIYAGASTRATRQQREHFLHAVDVWSAVAARYFEAVHRLYVFLDANPQRARNAFAQIYVDDDQAILAASERERALIVGARRAIVDLAAQEDAGKSEAYTLGEEADLVLNPFPAELTVHLGGEIVALEGFVRRDAEHVVIPRPALLDALASLEGKWISPDPFAAATRAEREQKKDVDVDALAAAPRTSLPIVAPSEIAAALLDAMRPAARYRVRWIERARR